MRNCLLQFIASIIALVLSMGILHGQCSYDVGTTIDDLETIELQFHVENLVNDDLAGNQGICGVALHFRHSYIGDVTIDLVSPAGQIVQLVGSVTDLISPTNLTTWNVLFVPCGFPVAPDAGFSAIWSNNQPWEVFTTYSGSYYPSSGCLEDFNIGSANGIWQLWVTDHDAPQTGELIGVTLIFCDNTGLICNLCGADGGEFIQTEYTICEGESILIGPQFIDTVPDPELFGYGYLFSPDNVNPTFSAQFQSESLQPGIYTLCGVSYGLADSQSLVNHMDTLTFTEIVQEFNTGQIGHCADISSNCVTITIEESLDTVFMNRQICFGASVQIGDQEYSAEGIYTIELDSPGECDSIIVLDLEVTNVEAIVLQQDTITCLDGATVLDGSSSVAGPGASFSWSTTNGSITSAQDQPSIAINGAGTYILTINDQGCVDELSYDVIGDNSFPYLFFEGGTLTCNDPTFTFNIVAFPSDVTYAWNGPSNFSSSEAEPTVSVPGNYTLIITDALGCSVANSAEILIDTTVNPSVTVTVVDCQAQVAILHADPGVPGTLYEWTHPVGPNTFGQETYATIGGQYCVSVTALNGCVSTACIDFLGDFSFPDLEAYAVPDTLHCGNFSQLIATSSIPSLTYQWNGSAGLLTNDSTFLASSPGQYVVFGRGENRCVSMDTVNVVRGDDLFDFVTFADTLDCITDTVLIGVATPEPIASYSWIGPGLVDTATAFVRVTEPGNYHVTFESVSGCIQYALIVVLSNYATVWYTLELDTITCTDPVADLSFIAYNEYSSIDWLLPDDSHSNQTVVSTVIPGTYTLTVTGLNGCPRTLAFKLEFDTLRPTLFIESDIIGCSDSTLMQTIRVDSIQSYLWTGPGGFSSSEPNPFVSASGSYLLTATGFNGCESTFIHFVSSDTTLPMLTHIAEELDCIDSVAVLELISPDSAIAFSWLFDGQMIADTSMIVISEPGIYIGIATGPNDCMSIDSVTVLPPAIPDLFAETDTITCIETASLTAMSDQPDVDFEWEESNGMISTGTQLSTGTAGALTLTVIGSNGCSHDTTLIVGIDTIPPVAVPNTNENILCNVPTIHLDASGSIGTSLTYLWTTSDGIIDSGATSPFPLIRGPGTYFVQVTDASNGCTDRDSLEVHLSESELGSIFISVISECEGNGNGSITIDSVPGGVMPLMFRLDGQTGGPVFADLGSGLYQIMVIDSFGCSFDTMMEITNSTSTIALSLGPDQEIIVGDSVLLEAIIGIDPSQVLSVNWGQQVGCDTCLSTYVAPLHTTVYDVQVEDASGCIAVDQVTIFVDERPQYYIPTAFSPNGDEVNDYLSVYAHPGIERILRFTVYDRWGNAVFHETDFDPADGNVRWDGTFKGEKLDPAVFVYIIELKLLTGRLETNHGNVTLVK